MSKAYSGQVPINVCTKTVAGFGMELYSCSLTEYTCKLLACGCLAALIFRRLSHMYRNCFILTRALLPAKRQELEWIYITCILLFFSVSLYSVFGVYCAVVT